MMKRLAWVLVVALVVAGCGQEVEEERTEEPIRTAGIPPAIDEVPVIASEPLVDRPRYGGLDPSLPDHVSLAALATGETEVFDAPSADSTTTTMPWTTILGTVSVYAVVGEPADGWVEVLLPVRPNGTTGWIRSEDIALYVIEGRIVVDLSDRQLTYYEHGDEVFSTAVAVGTLSNPTPTGQFYVTDSITMGYEGSPWGPHALGLSARSDTITEFNGGDGIIGIHGTNKPSSIGQAASLGCVRLPNDVITSLYEMVPIGTPVEIRA